MDIINEAVKHYNFSDCKFELIRHNENMTYKITNDNKNYILRIHKPVKGFNLDFLRNGKGQNELIESEIKILEYLSEKSSINTQHVIKNMNGNSITVLDNGLLVTVLEWINGETLENVDITNEIAFKIGIMIGKIHNAFSEIGTLNRYEYDERLLLKMISECDEALIKKHLDERQADIIKNTLEFMRNYILKSKKQYVLVHADLSKSNLIYNDNEIIPIDFSLSGYSLPEMDLASVFSNINDDKLNEEILNGYISTCNDEVDMKGIDIFFCFQILLFIISQHDKFGKESWFLEKVNEWCEEKFKPLISI